MSSFTERVHELQAALSLDKSRIARLLRVTRPTLHDWLRAREPNAANAEQLRTLLRMLARAGVSGANPLNARFVRRPVGIQDPSLVDLLCEERIDEDRVVHVIGHARALADSASRRRTAREERLHRLGFDDPGDEQRRRLVATNMALREWRAVGQDRQLDGGRDRESGLEPARPSTDPPGAAAGRLPHTSTTGISSRGVESDGASGTAAWQRFPRGRG